MISFIKPGVIVTAFLIVASTDAADRHADDRHSHRDRAMVIEDPGPLKQSVLYATGEEIEVPTTWRWRTMCGSRPVTQKELEEIVAPMRAGLDELDKEPDPRQVQGTISGSSGCGPSIVFNIDNSVPTAAQAGLQAVADYYSETFSDDITFIITVSFQALPGGVIGGTGSSFQNVQYVTTRVNLQNDMDSNDTIQDMLPTTNTLPVRYNGANDAVTNESLVGITRANYRAAIGTIGGIAATMTFNSNFAFDFDPSNGVPNSLLDFQSTVAHEVGHAMGFTSNADMQTPDVDMLDLFRFQFSDTCAAGGNCDYNPDSPGEFQTAPRLVDFNSPNDNVISDLGTQEWRMEDGSPNQASHFRESVPALMDPTLQGGESFFPNFLNNADRQMFDAIGWDWPPNGPCNDGDPCTIGDSCNGISCLGDTVDCSAQSDDCTAASCAANGPNGNCNLVDAINEGGPCNNGTGLCQNGACIAPGETRAFISAPGQQDVAPLTGPTMIVLPQGATATLEVWMADTAPQQVGGYQLAWPGEAAPHPGAAGTVTYLDNPNGEGDSVLIDSSRPDWVFDELSGVATFHSETGLPVGFAVIAVAPFGTGVPVEGIRYAAEFKLRASPDALGTFDFPWLFDGAPPNGGTSINDETGLNPVVTALQPLIIQVVEQGDCGTPSDCGDLDDNGITDDVCMWVSCDDAVCMAEPRAFADAGGLFANCQPDGFNSIHDRNHVIHCFEGTSPCEDFNLDLGGPFGACDPDGICDIHDADHALLAFAGESPCSCPGGPLPEFPPGIVGAAELSFVSTHTDVVPGDTIEVVVRLSTDVRNLQSYQLDVAAHGGTRGSLRLQNIAIEPVREFAFTTSPGLFSAFNAQRGQMFAGIDLAGRAVDANAYLATYRFVASHDAAGTFTVDIRPGGRTFLIAGRMHPIDVAGSSPAVVRVTPRP
jgi:hypothetical protein